MDEKQTHVVNRLKDFLIDQYNPELIILYGSTARGDTDEFSDIDMMVIMDVEDSDKVTADMLAGTDHIVYDKHIMLRSTDDYYNQKDIPGTMVYSALGEGLILFQRSGFETDSLPLKSYEDRKRDIIQKDYLEQAHEFLEKGKEALDSKQLFRCRDFLRFAAVRVLKAVMVFMDVHPSRSADLEELFKKAWELFPEIETYYPIIKDLNNYCPEENEAEDAEKCRELTEKACFVVDSVALFLD